VTVTMPIHPLKGLELKLVGMRRDHLARQQTLIAEVADGRHIVLPIDWTDRGSPWVCPRVDGKDVRLCSRGLAVLSRRRLMLDYASRDELLACLDHLLESAGNPSLMTTELKGTLADHAAGNYRVLMNLADELLTLALDRELPRLDEKLYLEAFAQPTQKKASSSPTRKR
jgi:hypothetical protein